MLGHRVVLDTWKEIQHPSRTGMPASGSEPESIEGRAGTLVRPLGHNSERLLLLLLLLLFRLRVRVRRHRATAVDFPNPKCQAKGQAKLVGHSHWHEVILQILLS